MTNRLKTYDNQMLPILDYYRKKGIVKDADAMKAINEVTGEIKSIISNL